MKPESSEARNAIAFAISSGYPLRLIGFLAATALHMMSNSCCVLGLYVVQIDVSICPGLQLQNKLIGRKIYFILTLIKSYGLTSRH